MYFGTSCNVCIFSWLNQKAFYNHSLDWIPFKIHLTVPEQWRCGQAQPSVHKAPFSHSRQLTVEISICKRLDLDTGMYVGEGMVVLCSNCLRVPMYKKNLLAHNICRKLLVSITAIQKALANWKKLLWSRTTGHGSLSTSDLKTGCQSIRYYFPLYFLN